MITLHPLKSIALLLWVAAMVPLALATWGLARTIGLLRRCRRARALLSKFGEQGQLTAEEWREFLDACEGLQIDTDLARSIAREAQTGLGRSPTHAYTNRDSDGS